MIRDGGTEGYQDGVDGQYTTARSCLGSVRHERAVARTILWHLQAFEALLLAGDANDSNARF